jgi:hypothetical protein
MTVTDEFLKNNENYAAGFGKGDLALPPAKQVAVVACMDARLDPARVLGLEEGDAHVIRNADIRPPFALESFKDLDADVRQSRASRRARSSPTRAASGAPSTT